MKKEGSLLSSKNPVFLTISAVNHEVLTVDIRTAGTGDKSHEGSNLRWVRKATGPNPSQHFGSLIFRTIPEENLAGSGASVAQEIGSLILLRIAGATTEDAKVESFETSKSFYEFGPVTFESRVKNLGNVHIKPSGNVTITNIVGQKVATVPLVTKNVLPGAIRKIEGTWDTKWRMGQYTATAVMIYGPNNTQLANVTTFIVFPYRLALVVLVVFSILFTFVYRSRRRLKMAWKILTSGKE